MSDLEKAIRASKRYESALARRFGATGRGLHEKTDSVEARLDRGVVRSLRLVATVRNKIVHEDGYDRIEDERSFDEACRRIDRALGLRRRVSKPALALVLIALAAAAFGLWRALR